LKLMSRAARWFGEFSTCSPMCSWPVCASARAALSEDVRRRETARLLVEGLGVGRGGGHVGVTGGLVGAGGELELVGGLEVGVAGLAVGTGVVLARVLSWPSLSLTVSRVSRAPDAPSRASTNASTARRNRGNRPPSCVQLAQSPQPAPLAVPLYPRPTQRAARPSTCLLLPVGAHLSRTLFCVWTQAGSIWAAG